MALFAGGTADKGQENIQLQKNFRIMGGVFMIQKRQ